MEWVKKVLGWVRNDTLSSPKFRAGASTSSAVPPARTGMSLGTPGMVPDGGLFAGKGAPGLPVTRGGSAAAIPAWLGAADLVQDARRADRRLCRRSYRSALAVPAPALRPAPAARLCPSAADPPLRPPPIPPTETLSGQAPAAMISARAAPHADDHRNVAVIVGLWRWDSSRSSRSARGGPASRTVPGGDRAERRPAGTR